MRNKIKSFRRLKWYVIILFSYYGHAISPICDFLKDIPSNSMLIFISVSGDMMCNSCTGVDINKIVQEIHNTHPIFRFIL